MKVEVSGVAVNGSCDMAFRLYDDPGGGNLIGSPITTTVPINNGLFTISLNFGDGSFDGNGRWLDIQMDCGSGFTQMTPRQALTPAPYALAFGAPGSVYGYLYDAGPSGLYPTIGFNTYGAPAYRAGAAGYGGVFQFHNEDGNLIYYTGSNVAVGEQHAFTERFAIQQDGRVGIGTNTPSDKLTVQTSPGSYGLVHTDGTAVVGTWVGAGGTSFESGWFGTKTNHPLRFFTGNGGSAMSIATNGDVLIGYEPYTGIAKLFVNNSSSSQYDLIKAQNSQGNYAFVVSDDGGVWVKNYHSATTWHVCNDGGWLADCASAAEYVPSVNSGSGFPETADLVSIAPAVANPYGDTHSPFAVEKAATPCDPNLLGFIVNPESGADGEKKNDHYLPLAIYGYFPAKVTLENGAIHRGDPLTSSSKPGYAMKATQACKIIGYALEDADQEGTIQVFANHGENAASEVASLRTQVQELKQTVADLKQENAALDARLTTLEQAMSGKTQVQSVPTPMDKSGSQ